MKEIVIRRSQADAPSGMATLPEAERPVQQTQGEKVQAPVIEKPVRNERQLWQLGMLAIGSRSKDEENPYFVK